MYIRLHPPMTFGDKADQQTGDQQRYRSAVKRALWSLLVPRDLQTSNLSVFRHKLTELTDVSNWSNRLFNLFTNQSANLFTNLFNFRK